MKTKEGESHSDEKRPRETEYSLPATLPKPRSRLVILLQKAYSSISPPPQQSQFIFENTEEAAKKNSTLIMSFNGDISAVLNNEKGSTLSPGSEFRDNEVINPLFDLHDDGDKLKELIKHGASYVFKEGTEQTEDERLADITAAVAQGNNHSTRGKERLIKTRYTNEVERGWMVPFSISEILAIQGLGVIPIGVASQFTINTEREKVRKDRLTHDCSRPQASGKSVNINTDKEKMEPCRFGLALLRVVYQIHMLRFLHPNIPILISKLDLDSAYRRLHVRLTHALLCTSIIGSVCYILFRLPFGSAGAPGLFSLFSEFVADISQALYDDETWNPEDLFSEMASEIGLGKFGDSPFAVARELSITIKTTLVSIDVYIDDLIVVLLFSPSRYQRIKNVIPLILDCLIRPLTTMEQVKRSSILQQTKLIAEGWFEESKVVLGWLINTRALRIFFPRMKAMQLKLELQELYKSYEDGNQVNRRLLESVIGKMVNICFIIPEGKFFINRLRFRLNRCTWKGCKSFDIMESKDLLFWIRAVDAIKEGSIGRSFNSILNTLANIIAFSDACERGLGGFFIIDGRIFAWRFELPEELQGIFTLNLLEFIAAFWTVKIICNYIHEARIRSHVDSTNALSWLKKNNHRPDLQPQHDEVARDYGMALLESDNSADEDYLEGDRNLIADALSRDTHIPSAKFIQELKENPATKDMMSGAKVAEQKAVVKKTHSKRLGDWKKWTEFLPTYGIKNDPFLQHFKIDEGYQISDVFQAYLVYYRANSFGTKISGEIREARLRQGLSNIRTRFEDEGFERPVTTSSGRLFPCLERQLQGYKTEDPASKQQAALPLIVFETLLRNNKTPLSEAIGQLTAGALYFAMRSCEYSYTGDGIRTDILKLENLKFYSKDGMEVKHNRQAAQKVKIVFPNQKNLEKDEPVIRSRAKESSKLCPVRAWGAIYDRISGYKDTTMKSTVNTVEIDGKLTTIDSATVRERIRTAVKAIGEEKLGFTSKEIGTHSIRTTYATLLFLRNVDPITIQIGGRWKSTAFLKYIRRDTTGYAITDGISKKKNRYIKKLK